MGGSAMPRSLAAKQAFLFELVDRGLPLDKAMKYLNMAESGKLYEELHIDEQQIDRENLKLLNGEAITINTWDAHDLHVPGHNQKRKTQEFEMASDEVKQNFELHVMGHMMALQGIPLEQIPMHLAQLMGALQNNKNQQMPGLASPVGSGLPSQMGQPTQPNEGSLQ